MFNKSSSRLKAKLICDIRGSHGQNRGRRDITPVLGAVTKLPLAYWEPHMFFFGAPDSELFDATGADFPYVIVPGKTHPVFSLEPLPDRVGYTACPCSSSVQKAVRVTCIRSGCILDYTSYRMDRDVYVLDRLRFPVPRAISGWLRFKGRVPQTCLCVDTRKRSPHAFRGDRKP